MTLVLADALLVLHGLFIAWATLGALAVARWPKLAWLHLPALAWAAWVSFSGAICPLTPWEQSLRRAAGEAGYAGGFIEHYLGAAIYPAGLTLAHQRAIGVALLAINLGLYAFVLYRVISRRQQETAP